MYKFMIHTDNKEFNKIVEYWRKQNLNISTELVNLILAAECAGLLQQIEDNINIITPL